jgi:hypothetical protein
MGVIVGLVGQYPPINLHCSSVPTTYKNHLSTCFKQGKVAVNLISFVFHSLLKIKKLTSVFFFLCLTLERP